MLNIANPDNIPVSIYRFGNWVFYRVRVPVLRQLLWVAYKFLDVFVVRFAFGADIPARCHIGSNLHLKHGGNGVVIHCNAVIGDDVTIHHHVTIGKRSKGGVPEIGNNVYIGVGAVILGEIRVGEGAQIGANAVVLKDVPPRATAVGVPARILPGVAR